MAIEQADRSLGDVPAAADPQTPEISECAAIVRDMIRYESEQVHRRLSWLATFQGLIFAAFGLSFNSAPFLRPVIEVLGIYVAFLSLIGVGSAALATRNLHAYWEPKRAEYSGPPIDGFFQRHLALAFLSPDLLLPAGFIAVWLVVMLWR